MSRVEGAGSPIRRLPVCSPVQSPKPVNTMAPTPLASRAGSITANNWGPPTPATSISRTAATRGLPKIAEMAAAAPAAPSSAVLAVVAGARTRSRKSSARPPPSAISGDSGPRTAPSGRLARAARTTPGSAEVDTPAGMQPRGRNVAAAARQPQHDRNHEQTRREHRRQRPPPRRIRPSEIVRPLHPHQMFQLVQEYQEPERGQGDRDTDHGAEHERPPVRRLHQHVPQLLGLRGLVSGRGLGLRRPAARSGLGLLGLLGRLGLLGLLGLRLGDGSSPTPLGGFCRRSASVPTRPAPPTRPAHDRPKTLRVDAPQRPPCGISAGHPDIRSPETDRHPTLAP